MSGNVGRTTFWDRWRLLIAEEHLDAAAKRRVWLGVIAAVLGLVACQRGWGGGTYTFVGSIMGGLHLLVFSSGVRRWKRERGLWMAYTVFAAIAVFMYSIMLQAPAIPWGALTGSALRAPHPRVVAAACDAAVGGWLFLLSVRLQISAAVANFRRFRSGAGGWPPARAQV